jgi:hypothetical protein
MTSTPQVDVEELKK